MTRIPLRVHPRPCRTLVRRLASGPLARDLRRNAALIALCTALLLIAAILTLLDGYYVTWTGVEPLPTPSELPCDYCGTDAGLLDTP